MRVLCDTAIFVYAVGTEHRYRDPCRAILASAARRELSGLVSADLLQEFVHQRARRTGDRAKAVVDAQAIPVSCEVLDVTLAVATRALELFASHSRLDARDAVFAAVALEHGVTHVVSPDGAFDAVSGLTRVDPLDADAVAALAG